MIDVETDVFDAVARAVLEVCPDALVSGEHQIAPPTFPFVSCWEMRHDPVSDTHDAPYEKYANVTYMVNVYSREGKAEAKRIGSAVCDLMASMNFTRMSYGPVDNAADPSVYRLAGRFSAVVDTSKHFFRR